MAGPLRHGYLPPNMPRCVIHYNPYVHALPFLLSHALLTNPSKPPLLFFFLTCAQQSSPPSHTNQIHDEIKTMSFASAYCMALAVEAPLPTYLPTYLGNLPTESKQLGCPKKTKQNNKNRNLHIFPASLTFPCLIFWPRTT